MCYFCNAFSIRNKIDEWRVLIDVMKPEIAYVAESKLHVENDHDDAFEVSGFILYRDDRIHKGGGGVVLWVSDNMKYKIIDFVTSCCKTCANRMCLDLFSKT